MTLPKSKCMNETDKHIQGIKYNPLCSLIHTNNWYDFTFIFFTAERKKDIFTDHFPKSVKHWVMIIYNKKSHKHTNTLMCAHACACVHTHTHMHTHTHTHTRTQTKNNKNMTATIAIQILHTYTYTLHTHTCMSTHQ